MADSNADATNASGKKGSMLIVTLLVAILAAAGAGAGVYFATAKSRDMSDEAVQARGRAPKGPALYVELDPPFVVNFEARGMTRFLQVAVQVMTRDPATADLIKQHDPVIRNDLLMLLSNQTQESISSRDGKEQLRLQALEVVANAIEAEGGNGKNVEQLYFTSFVMQ